ncbi:hypothetical protein HRQ87_04880 [Sulfitobacter sp. 1151]|uniref:PAS domain-containing protein n=2 Tax=Parasulfitobacter algicola TaxID=2614809 RepID=A0ABX2ISS0_9RHOB|nr:hypothetical protein [Sulfitobacter algicola]
MILNRKFEFVAVNPAYEKMVGITSRICLENSFSTLFQKPKIALKA